ncbi:MAG: amino acid-binding ACT domain-containing protein [Acidobacteria bacterium]|nr:amino acid-binding ACT domain-containing protein [Acidobacteriota bacterium]
MFDVTIQLENRPGAMAEMGGALGLAGISVEGGGGWVAEGKATMHFLFEHGEAARSALQKAGIKVFDVREVLVQKLGQDVPGHLGKIARRMADAGVNIEVIYSDHANQLILVVDDFEKGKVVSDGFD